MNLLFSPAVLSRQTGSNNGIDGSGPGPVEVCMSAIKTFVLACAICASIVTVGASAMSVERIEQATERIKDLRHDWTTKDTEEFLAGRGPQSINMNGGAVAGGTSTGFFIADDGHRVALFAEGDSMLVGGKDVTGTLGNKNTYGPNSPILEDLRNSPVAIGSGSSASSTVNYSVTISLSVALSMSLAANVYLFRALRKLRTPSRVARVAAAKRTKQDS